MILDWLFDDTERMAQFAEKHYLGCWEYDAVNYDPDATDRNVIIFELLNGMGDFKIIYYGPPDRSKNLWDTMGEEEAGWSIVRTNSVAQDLIKGKPDRARYRYYGKLNSRA